MERRQVERALLDEAGRENLAKRGAYLRERYRDRGQTGSEADEFVRRVSGNEFDLNALMQP